MSKYYQGFFKPENPEKYIGNLTDIVFRSSWEKRFMKWCDKNPSVLKWNSEGMTIPYFSKADNKERRYFVDFIVQINTKEDEIKTLLVEIKPKSQTLPPRKRSRKTKTWILEQYNFQVNQDKWEAARAFAKKNGMEFVILTEHDLGIKK